MFDITEKGSEVRRLYRQVRVIVRVEKFELVVDIPRTFVPRRSGEEAALFLACRQERLQELVTLRVRVSEVMAFIYKDKISVFVPFEQQIFRLLPIATEDPAGDDLCIEAMKLVVTLPHRDKGGRTQDQGTCVLHLFKVFYDRGPDETFA